MAPPLHVVLGAGQIGPLVAARLAARGLAVRIVRQGRFAAPMPGVEQVSADLLDPSARARIFGGAAVVYHCVNPPYTTWARRLLPLTDAIVAGARDAGARLVALDNVYMYGDTARIAEDAPVAPRSRKGALRAEAAARMLAAGAAIGRAADFVGPGAAQGAIFGEHFWRRVLAGKPAIVFGDPDQPHSYSYTPDVAAGLVALGLDDDARGVSMLPVQPAEPTRAVIDRFARALDRAIRLRRLPTWALRVIGVGVPLVRELAEMAYQWEQPYRIDDTRFRARYGLTPTPWDEQVAATTRWARSTYQQPSDLPSPEPVA